MVPPVLKKYGFWLFFAACLCAIAYCSAQVVAQWLNESNSKSLNSITAPPQQKRSPILPFCGFQKRNST
jgi:hypothetical protein